jgi:hypothetical protein
VSIILSKSCLFANTSMLEFFPHLQEVSGVERIDDVKGATPDGSDPDRPNRTRRALHRQSEDRDRPHELVVHEPGEDCRLARWFERRYSGFGQ